VSFLIDPPMLFVIGAALYFAGKKSGLERLAKITIGLVIVLAFISFSSLLYLDIFPWVQTNDQGVQTNNSSSAFMLHTNGPIIKTGISKDQFPTLFVAIIFLLVYPLALFAGYASALLFSKKRRRKLLPGSRSYNDVNSRSRIAKNPKYSIVRYPDNQNDISNLKEAVEEAVKKLDSNGMKGFVKRNDRVLIKANICGGNPTNSATYTSKELVGYIVDMVREAGGEPFICDADMVWSKFSVAAKGEGWYEWAKKKNVELKNLSETDLVYFDFLDNTVFEHNERPNQEIVSKELLDADVIISVPKMKTHLSTSVSLGMKNMYGTLPNEDKANYHKNSAVEGLLYWVNYAFTPTLTIIDGSEGGEAEGPLAAQSVQYNTIVASNNVVLADTIASKLMGFDPFKDIKFLRYARGMMGTERSLLGSIPSDLYLTAPQLISKWELPANSKDGNWEKADPRSVEETQNFIEKAYGIPGAATVYNIGADFLLLDAANLPYLNTIQRALMKIMFAPRFWAEKTQETGASKNRTRINLAIFYILALISLYFFFKNGYLPRSSSYFLSDLNNSLGIILGFTLTLILGALFVRMMETKHLIAITFSSLIIAYLVESYALRANWWHYNYENVTGSWLLSGLSLAKPPYWPLFAVPLLIITLVGISYHVVRPTLFSLKGRRFRLVPYVVITLGIFAFLNFGGYVNYVKLSGPNASIMMIIYGVMAILALYFNERNDLDWNLAVTLVAVALGFLMEYFGMIANYWSYPGNIKLTMPVFVSLSWALNIWAVGGLALIFGKNMSQSFVKDQTFDPEDPQALSHRGDTFRAKCDYDEAIKFYDKAIEKNPNLAEAYHGKGMALAGHGDFKNSVKAYDEAVELYKDLYPDSAVPQVAQVLYHKAVSVRNLEGPLESLRAFKEALDYSSQALKANPRIIDTYIDVLLDLALAHQEMGDYKGSIALFKNEKIPDHIKKIFSAQEKAVLEDFMGFSQIDGASRGASDCCSYTNALRKFEEAIKLSSRDTDRTWSAAALWGKGCALAMQGKYDDSLHDFDDSLHAFQDSLHASHNSTLDQPSKGSALVWSDKGDALWDQGKFKDSIKAYDKAIELYTEFADEVKRSQGWRIKEDSHYKPEAQAHKGKGDAHFELRNFDLAYKAYSRSIQKLDKFVDDSDAKSAKGCNLSRMGRYKEAIKAYSDAIKIASKKEGKEAEAMSAIKKRSLEKAHIGKGNVHAKMGEFNESLIEYDKAIQINDKNIIAWNNKGIAYARLGKNDLAMYEEAKKCYVKAGAIEPSAHVSDNKEIASNQKTREANILYADAWYNKGIALYNQGNYDEALKAYGEALKINDQHPSAWNNKGAVLADLERYGDALDAYIKAINVNSKDAEALCNKGLILIHQKKYDEAIECFNKSIKANPRFAEAYYDKGMALYGHGKYDKAIKFINNSMKLKPSHPIAWLYYKGRILEALNLGSEAESVFIELQKMAPKDAEDWYYKGVILIDQKKYDEAIKCFDRTIEANPRFADAYYYKGMALNSQGKYNDAKKYIGKFMELKSSLPIAGSLQDITQIPKPPIVPEKSKPHMKAERLNSRYDEVWLQKGAYFVMLRHVNRNG
jgi:tetratricopeptide (TPR) repeat protein/uncharacterized protein (DUF362 family)